VIKISNVEFNVLNIKRCLCPQCPVQEGSICVEGKKRIMAQIAWSSEIGMYFEADRVPGLYCSTGKAICKDIDPQKRCRCAECEVWKDYNLGNEFPEFYYCQYGSKE